mmetsp:Transcript_25012/g.70330  ORF Transcript_25012/g.70330 Transcript_25012/m.70330 type:complete len:264 (+) Transcript_25012:371-1162(+)
MARALVLGREGLARGQIRLHGVHAQFSFLNSFLPIQAGVFPHLRRRVAALRGRLRRDGGLPFVSGSFQFVPKRRFGGGDGRFALLAFELGTDHFFPEPRSGLPPLQVLGFDLLEARGGLVAPRSQFCLAPRGVRFVGAQSRKVRLERLRQRPEGRFPFIGSPLAILLPRVALALRDERELFPSSQLLGLAEQFSLRGRELGLLALGVLPLVLLARIGGGLAREVGVQVVAEGSPFGGGVPGRVDALAQRGGGLRRRLGVEAVP